MKSVPFSSALGLLLLASVLAGRDEAGVELNPGTWELKFKNGSTARGKVESIEGDKFRFKPFDAPAFTMPLARLESARPLNDVVAAVGTAIAESKALGHREAMERLVPLLDEVSDRELRVMLAEEITRREQERNRANSAVRDQRREVFRAKYDSATAAGGWEEALELALAELADYPDDEELLANAVMMQYRIHRSAGKSALQFRSAQLNALRRINPRSTAAHGIAMEMETAARGQINWSEERDDYMANALEIAQSYYDNFQLKEAREVIQRALGYQPEAGIAVPLKKLLGKVDAELASVKADEKAREAERQKAMQEKLRDAQTRGQLITEEQSKNFDARLQRKAEFAPRLRR